MSSSVVRDADDGGPILVALMGTPPKAALMTVFAIFLVGDVTAAPAPSYPVMMITRVILDVVIGSSLGGPAIDAYGLRAPLWLGAVLAAVGLLPRLPDLPRRRPPVRRAEVQGERPLSRAVEGRGVAGSGGAVAGS